MHDLSVDDNPPSRPIAQSAVDDVAERPGKETAMTPEIQRLDVNAQLQDKLAARARNEVEIAQLQHQARMYLVQTPQLPPASPPERSNSGYVMLVIALIVIVIGLVAQNEHYFRHY
jgi:hypothetical protein